MFDHYKFFSECLHGMSSRELFCINFDNAYTKQHCYFLQHAVSDLKDDQLKTSYCLQDTFVNSYLN